MTVMVAIYCLSSCVWDGSSLITSLSHRPSLVNHLSVIFNDEQSDISEDLKSHSVTNEVASEDPATNHAISTNTELRLLSWPVELRLIVFRFLLLEHRPLSTNWMDAAYIAFPAIFKTCRQIRREAFQVMFGENVFFVRFPRPRFSLLHNRLVVNTIQKLHVSVCLNDPSYHPRRLNFFRAIHEFGSPAIVRNALNVIVYVGNATPRHLLLRYVGGLGRFTNFRNIRIEFVPDPEQLDPVGGLCFLTCRVCEDYFTPMFGPAEVFADGCGVQFYPQSHLSSLPPIVYVDWMDYLDGIRLDWDSDPLTNTDETDASAQNSDSKA